MTKYERNYISWYLKSTRKLYVLFFIIAFLAIPFVAIIAPSYTLGDRFSIPMLTQNLSVSAIGIVLAFFMAIYNFRFLMNKRSVIVYMAMPIVRKRFFVIQYVLGAMVVFVLPMMMYGIAMIIDSGTYVEAFTYIKIAGSIGILSLVLYTLYVALIIKCNNLWDAILVCLGYTILPFLIFLGLSALLYSAVQTSLLSSLARVEEFFPLLDMIECISPPTVMFTMGAAINTANNTVHLDGGSIELIIGNNDGFSYWYVLLWIVIAILLFLLARHMYNKRGSETSEQVTKAYMCYPFLSLFVIATLLMVSVETYASGGSVHVTMSMVMIVLAFVIYLIMNFFARRKIQLTKDMVISFVAIVVAVFSLSYTCASTKGFYRVEEIPEYDDIVSTSISFNYTCDYTVTENGEQRRLNGLFFTFDDPAYEVLNDVAISNLNFEKDTEDEEVKEDIYAFHKYLIDNQDTVHLNKYGQVDAETITISFSYEDAFNKRRHRQYTVTDGTINKEKLEDLLTNLVEKGMFGKAEYIKKNNDRNYAGPY